MTHTRASHYGKALNAYAAWYRANIRSDALFSVRYGFAYEMVNTALDLGWIPNETPLPLRDCTCGLTPPPERLQDASSS